MDGKLRNMTSVYLTGEKGILCLFRIGSRFANNKYIGSGKMSNKMVHQFSTGHRAKAKIVTNFSYTSQTGAEAVCFKKNNFASFALGSNSSSNTCRTAADNRDIKFHKKILRNNIVGYSHSFYSMR